MNLLRTLFYSFVMGITEILPVSSQAHQMLISALKGGTSEPALLRFLIHIGIGIALYLNCQNHILRISRAQRLSRIAKRKRTRPLDNNSLMDLRILQTTLIPIALGFINFQRLQSLVPTLNVLSGVLLINGLILYLPQYLPGSNKTSLSISPFDSLLMGIGAVASLIPGISCIGIVLSIALIRGVEKLYALNIALLMNIGMTVGWLIWDLIAMIQGGMGVTSFLGVLYAILGGATACGATLLAIWVMKKFAASKGFGVFAFYAWGTAMFLFILFLSV